MTKDTLQDLRARLLRQHNVQQMIQVRAYEIFQMRGGQPGGEAQDWFHAESEVLAFLLADESAREEDQAEATSANETSPQDAPAEAPARKKPRSGASGKPADGKEAAPKKAAGKRATPKKPVESKSRSKPIGRKSKPEESAQ